VVQGPDPVDGPVSMVGPMPVNTATSDRLVDTSFAAESLIEEPITSGSDSSLWECVPGNENCKPSDGND